MQKNISFLETLPKEWAAELLPDIRKEIADSDYTIVILDDDPTGTQTVKDLPVLTHWSKEALQQELSGHHHAFFILTNSRSLIAPDACALAEEIGRNLKYASEVAGTRVILVSRSDSTLRGHFPAEVDAMAAVTGKADLPYLICPFFLEGGRFTVGDMHYVQDEELLVPAALTPFAKDAVFGFHHSNLKEWVEEKTEGKIPADSVISILIEDLRIGGPCRVASLLRDVPPKSACIVNGTSYRDMEVFVSALLQVEREGKEFLYRTAASFVRTRTGLDHRTPLLTKSEITSSSSHGGLFVIGSYVEKTTLQVEALFEKTDIKSCEVVVAHLLDPNTKEAEIDRVSGEITQTLQTGADIAVFTSRSLITGNDARTNLEIGRLVSDSLIEIVSKVSLQPRYLVAKGGITSSDVATKGLGVRRAMVLGQALPGVPVWQLGPETRYPGMPYIIFPGNVGSNDALVQIQRMLK